jgi:parallel beta-helix repeat protein
MIYFSLMVFSMLLWFGNTAYAATYWVAKTGSDSHSCTQSQSESTPKLTIRSALSCLSAGSTLMVKTGIYHEGEIRLPGGTSWTSPVTIMANPGDTVTVSPPSKIDSLLDLTKASQSYLIIDGFILDAANVGFGIWIEHAHHIRVKNTEVKNARVQGIAVFGNPSSSQFVELLNLNVHHNGLSCYKDGLCHGVYMSSDDNLIDGGSWHDNGGHGVHIYNDPANGKGTPDRNIVRNIRAYGNTNGPGIGVYWGTGNKVYNNLIYKNNGGGIRVAAVNSLFLNNTVYGNKNYGVYVDNSGNTFKNNIVYNNSGGNITSLSSNRLSNNLTTQDPRFVNADAGDFRLQAGSPAIDTGVTISDVITDFDKAPRPQGAGVDIGAYEYTGSPRSTPTRPRITKQ